MANLNPTRRLKSLGLNVTASSSSNIALGDIYVETEGLTKHPRWGLPLSEPLVQHIMVKGMRDKATGERWMFLLKERGEHDGKLRQELGNGARRLKNGLEAERRLRETKPRQSPLVFDKDDPSDLGHLMVGFIPFVGDDVAFLKARLAANSRPDDMPDSVEVLAITVAQLKAALCENVDDIVAVMPPHVGPAEVQALQRWDNLTAAAKARFVEANAPLGILDAVLRAPDAEQLPRLEKFLAEGIVTGRQATRRLNADRRINSGAPHVWTPKKIAGFAKVFTPTSSWDEAFHAGLLFRGDGDSDTLPPHVQRAIRAYDEKPRAAKQIR